MADLKIRSSSLPRVPRPLSARVYLARDVWRALPMAGVIALAVVLIGTVTCLLNSAVAWEEGWATPLEQAVTYALEVGEPCYAVNSTSCPIRSFFSAPGRPVKAR